jgi:peptidoglycan/LPS O-acetylase OafA/YrhL
MSEFFTSGRVADLILGVMALEAVILLFYWRKTRRGIAPAATLINLLAGACLVLALRSALVGAHWTWTAACLAAALVVHLLDLGQRWKR